MRLTLRRKLTGPCVEKICLILLLNHSLSLSILCVVLLARQQDALLELLEYQSFLLKIILFPHKLGDLRRDDLVILLHLPILVQTVSIVDYVSVADVKLDPGVLVYGRHQLCVRFFREKLAIRCQLGWSFGIKVAFKVARLVLLFWLEIVGAARLTSAGSG